MTTYTIGQIKRLNHLAGGHFFDRDTLQFFNSRVHDTVYGGRYFITSEQFVAHDGTAEPRMYTVRRFNDDGSIDTMGYFQQYATSIQARFEAMRLARLEDDETVTI